MSKRATRLATAARWRAVLALAAIACRASSFPVRDGGIRTAPRGRAGAGAGAARLRPPRARRSAGGDAADMKRGGTGRRRRPRLPERNLYELLGADPAMSRAEIKRRYIALAKRTHPDASPDPDGGAAADGSGFNEVARAWSVLSDARSRRAYDRELAAQDFKDGVVSRAGEVAREYGPAARKLYDDIAIPFLRRTTATTVAGWNAVSEEAAELVEEDAIQEGGDALEDLGRAFKRVVEAGRNATRQIDGMELGEKSVGLGSEGDEVRAEAMEALGRLTEIKSERLGLTFLTSSANFTSKDVIQYLDGFGEGIMTEQVTVMQWVSSNKIGKDVLAFDAAETDFERRAAEKSEIDREVELKHKWLRAAEEELRAAAQAEELARKMLEDSRRRVAESERSVVEAKESIRNMYTTVKRADAELSKAGATLRRKRNVVRRQMKQKVGAAAEGSVFDQGEGRVRLNPVLDKSSMSAVGFEERNLAAIEALRKDESRVEAEFSRLLDRANRLATRSERLRVRSEELIGETPGATNVDEDQRAQTR